MTSNNILRYVSLRGPRVSLAQRASWMMISHDPPGTLEVRLSEIRRSADFASARNALIDQFLAGDVLVGITKLSKNPATARLGELLTDFPADHDHASFLARLEPILISADFNAPPDEVARGDTYSQVRQALWSSWAALAFRPHGRVRELRTVYVWLVALHLIRNADGFSAALMLYRARRLHASVPRSFVDDAVFDFAPPTKVPPRPPHDPTHVDPGLERARLAKADLERLERLAQSRIRSRTTGENAPEGRPLRPSWELSHDELARADRRLAEAVDELGLRAEVYSLLALRETLTQRAETELGRLATPAFEARRRSEVR